MVYAHLRDVDGEEFLSTEGEVECDSCEFGVFVEGADPVPPAGLNKPVAAVDVEPLLPVPTLWAAASRWASGDENSCCPGRT